LAILALFLPLRSSGDMAALGPICVGLVLTGAGIGMSWPALVTRIFRSAPEDEQDLASGGMTTVQLFAMAFGTACAGMVANLAGISVPGGVQGASSAAFWLGAVFMLAPIAAIAAGRRLVRLVG